jgi:CheY-like chemotaxis protein
MPGEDGYELIRQLRQHDVAEGARIPAIALTAYTRAEDRTRALVAGFDLHLEKPVSACELVDAIVQLAGPIQPSDSV